MMSGNQKSFNETDALPCSSCWKTNIEVRRDEKAGTVYIHCLSCGMNGKGYLTEFQAIRSWNKAALHAMKKKGK